MKWIQERDLLIAQTMTFVQSITGTKPEALVRPETRVEIAAPDPIQSSESPPLHRVVPHPVPASPAGLREEIRRRVAAFRAHQQLFDRDRDAYCDAVVTRLRASLADKPKSTGH
jgi:hypothetical protein